MKKLSFVFGIFVMFGSVALGTEIDRALARQYFAEAQQMCTADAGMLWGSSLCGPIMFVDPQTRAVVTNHAAADLHPADGVFVGGLPKELGVANTAAEWAGMWWTQLLWPLPTDAPSRRVLLAHESFHRLQKAFPKETTASDNVDSLDSAQGRYFMQLEWRALARALSAPKQQRNEFVRDALVFRERRHQLFPKDVASELQQLSNEGLAEYTGVKLGGKDAGEQKDLALKDLDSAEKKPSFVRAFAYGSGPAYGLLLDEVRVGWRTKQLTAYKDMPDLLQAALHIDLPKDIAAAAKVRSANYDGTALFASETE